MVWRKLWLVKEIWGPGQEDAVCGGCGLWSVEEVVEEAELWLVKEGGARPALGMSLVAFWVARRRTCSFVEERPWYIFEGNRERGAVRAVGYQEWGCSRVPVSGRCQA